MTDIELCRLIDTDLVPRLLDNPEKTSVYDVPLSRRIQLFDRLREESQAARYRKGRSVFGNKFVTDAQLQRCLCLKYAGDATG